MCDRSLFSAYSEAFNYWEHLHDPDKWVELATIHRRFGSLQGAAKLFGHLMDSVPKYPKMHRAVLSCAVVSSRVMRLATFLGLVYPHRLQNG